MIYELTPLHACGGLVGGGAGCSRFEVPSSNPAQDHRSLYGVSGLMSIKPNQNDLRAENIQVSLIKPHVVVSRVKS